MASSILTPLHAKLKQFLHGDGTSAIGDGDDDAMDFLLVIDLHQVRGDGFVFDCTFHLAGPTGDLDADFRTLAQALYHPLGALAVAEDIDAFDQDRQLDQPGKTNPPTE